MCNFPYMKNLPYQYSKGEVAKNPIPLIRYVTRWVKNEHNQSSTENLLSNRWLLGK